MRTTKGGWLLPRAVRPGGRVGLVTPAGPVEPGRVEAAGALCRDLGFEPVVARGVEERRGFLAGSDADRLARLQSAFDDRSLDMIWAIRGGYGSQRIVDDLDLSRQVKDPIPFVGFSDNTSVLARHDAHRVVSFHGPHPGLPMEPWARASLLAAVTGEGKVDAPQDAVEAVRTLVEGRAHGTLWVGNLAMAASMCGTGDLEPWRGRVVALEDVGEAAYRVDRMLLQLRRSGMLDGAAGLVFGRFTDVPGGNDEGVAEVLCEFAEVLGLPAVLGWPFGHVEGHATLPMGVAVTLDASSASLVIEEAGVRPD